MLDPIISTLAALTLSALFANAALHKVRHRAWFRRQLKAYQLLPGRLLTPVAIGLPLLELATAVALLWPPVRSGAGIIAAALLTLYGWAIAINLWRGRQTMDCGCSGPAVRHPLQPGLLVRNAALVGLTLFTIPEPVLRTMALHDYFISLAAACTLSLLYSAADNWLANQPLLHQRSAFK